MKPYFISARAERADRVISAPADDQEIVPPPQPAKSEQVKYLKREEPSNSRINLKVFRMLRVTPDSGQQMYVIGKFEPADDSRNSKPEWSDPAYNKETIFTLLLIQGHQNQSGFRSFHDAVPVCSQRLFAFYGIEIPKAGIHQKFIARRNRFPVTNLENISFTGRRGKTLTNIGKIGNVFGRQYSGVYKGLNNQRFVIVD